MKPNKLVQCYWSRQDGNGTISWNDAILTPKGHSQALTANKFWKESTSTSKIPFPATFYTSPMSRCLDTVNLTFADLSAFHETEKPFSPIVKEVTTPLPSPSISSI
jgi:broad specificity phosphatase PhoE